MASTASSGQIVPAHMIGRYIIEDRLGEGAMAEVYRARDPAIGRRVAVKLLKQEFARDEGIVARFIREAKAAGALSHPNIATIYEVGEEADKAYIAMELVEGQPLDEVLRVGGRMPYERVLILGQQLAGALAYAHRKGIVHRDVKPSNILLSRDGRTAKLVDFGVARMDEAGEGEHLARTQFGQFLGTPRYMSPEQALGLAVDHRSDLFSLGIVLYEMITGKVAFPGIGLATLAIQIAQENVVPIGQVASDCPPGLKSIVERLLAKKPEQRFGDGAAVEQALLGEMHAEDEAPRHKGLSLRVTLPLFLGGLSLLLITLSASTILAREDRARENMAIASGDAISAFVAANAGLIAAENAGLARNEQDWASVRAFVQSASANPQISSMLVTDADGIIRGATDSRRLGAVYRTSPAATVDTDVPGLDVARLTTSRGAVMRFVREIEYAGATFGKVEVTVRTTALDAAASELRQLLAVIGLFVTLIGAAMGYVCAHAIVRPLARLRGALDDVAATGSSTRIAHRRSDEFGVAFDAFNRAANRLETGGGPRVDGTAPALDATRIAFAGSMAEREIDQGKADV